MIKKKILVVAPYPVVNPRHGGQKRVKAIYDFYKTIFEEVKLVAVFHRGLYPEKGKDDLWLGDANLISEIDANPRAAELIQGRAINEDIHVRSYMAKLLWDYEPDIIQVEQIYPYLGLKPLLSELQLRPKLILSSQNIEYRMKQSMYKGSNVSEKAIQEIVRETKELEQQFSRDADLVIAVSRQDAKAHMQMGAKKCVVAPNGIDKVTPSREAISRWQAFKKESNIEQAITFVASAHPPNWTGFTNMIGTDTTFITSDAKILFAGGVSEYFKKAHTYNDKDQTHSKFWSGAVPLGQLSEDDLAGVIHVSDIMLLPITSGGGSNLKTAEAILSGKKIVATSYAFRGFERHLRLPNIYIADSQEKFRATLLKSINEPYIQRKSRQVRLAEQVQWQYCLAPIKRELKKVARRNVRARTSPKIKATIRRLKAAHNKYNLRP